MTTESAPALALVLYLTGLVAAFGVRSWVHRRRTGSSGFHGISGAPGSQSWWAGVLFVLALVLGVAAPVLDLTGALPAPHAALTDAAALVGLVLLVLGSAAVLAGQAGMGTSWRIGVDEHERTDLVTTGVFGVVRNPIFTAMVITQTGLALAVPTAVSGAALACLIVAVELQVRVLEEPHLHRIHGAAYQAYAARTGRFLPHIGRLRHEAHPAQAHPPPG